MADSKIKRGFAYSEITLKLRDSIHRQKYQPGEQMPTLVELAKQYGVSHSTVRLAFKQLAAEGLLVVQQGRGTFVAAPKQVYRPTVDFGVQFGSDETEITTHILDMRWGEPHQDGANMLEIPRGEQIWTVMLLHHLEGVPTMAEVLDIPKRLASHFVGESRRVRAWARALAEELNFPDLRAHVLRVNVMSERYYDGLFDAPVGTSFYEIRQLLSARSEPLLMRYLCLRTDRYFLDFQEQGLFLERGEHAVASHETGLRAVMHERMGETA